ncbi:hypothetical protein ACLQ2N_20960 [Streptomyces sp. DT224]|uniref:hypothetical protein n=1 Tax=Streptomyces sp. DT224 TaxID=3393426 RepID=UPI003CE8D3A2
MVRAFQVATTDGAVTGNPPAATGSSPRAAADGDPGTVYRGARAAGDDEPLVVDLVAARPVGSVTALRPSGSRERRRHPVAYGAWPTVGAPHGAYTAIDAAGRTTVFGTVVRR